MEHQDEVVQRFLDASDEFANTTYGKNVSWLDRDKSLAREERVEAIAHDPHRGSLAIEHTLVELFEGEREKIKGPLGAVFEPLQRNPSLVLPEYHILIQPRFDAIPKGSDWQEAQSALTAWLLKAKHTLPIGSSEHTVPGLGFELRLAVTKTHYGAGLEGVHVAYRGVPDTFDNVVMSRLKRKLDKLVKARQEDGGPIDCRVLLLELNSREKGLFWDVQRSIAAHQAEFPALEKIDAVWVADTSDDTSQFNRWLYARIWPNLNDLDAVLVARW